MSEKKKRRLSCFEDKRAAYFRWDETSFITFFLWGGGGVSTYGYNKKWMDEQA